MTLMKHLTTTGGHPLAHPFQLPRRRIPASQVKLINRLAAAPVDLVLEDAFLGDITIQRDDTLLQDFIAAERISLVCEDVTFRLVLSQPVLQPLLKHHNVVEELPGLRRDTQLAALVVEHLLGGLLDRFEAASGLTVAMTSVDIASVSMAGTFPATAIPLRIGCALWDEPVGGILSSTDHGAEDILEELVDVIPCPKTDAPSKAAVLAGMADALVLGPKLTMTRAELRELCPGDGVLLPPQASLIDELFLRIANHLTARCEIDSESRGLRLISAPEPDHSSPSARLDPTLGASHDPMKEFSPMSTDTARREGVLDDLPLTLSIELSRTEIPFHELERLWVGSIVSVPGAFDTDVTLIANGRRFARGELVAVEDADGSLRHGVRLTSFDDGRGAGADTDDA